jgi:heme exporter protein C
VVKTRYASLLAAILLADAVITILAVLRAPYPARVPLGSPAAYLNIYIHVPVAMVSYVLYTGAFISAILYLIKRRMVYDVLTYSFTFTASLYAAYTLLSGSLWASESWGAAWNWDPRETGVLLLFLSYLAYFAVRHGISDPDRAPVVASVYAIAAFSMVPISYLAPRIAASSLHPTQALLQGFMEQPIVRAYFYTKVILVLLIGLLITKLLADAITYRGGPTSSKAVRLVVLSALASTLAIIAASVALAQGYAGGSVGRVYAVFNGGHTLLVRLSSGYYNITISEPPKEYMLLHGHIVRLIGFNGSTAEKLEVLIPPCVIANLALYGLLISALALSVARLPGRVGGLWLEEVEQ